VAHRAVRGPEAGQSRDMLVLIADEPISRTRCLLIDFDGPMCDIYAGLTDAGQVDRSRDDRAGSRGRRHSAAGPVCSRRRHQRTRHRPRHRRRQQQLTLGRCASGEVSDSGVCAVQQGSSPLPRTWLRLRTDRLPAIGRGEPNGQADSLQVANGRRDDRRNCRWCRI
jgi:hypothetical protein